MIEQEGTEETEGDPIRNSGEFHYLSSVVEFARIPDLTDR